MKCKCCYLLFLFWISSQSIFVCQAAYRSQSFYDFEGSDQSPVLAHDDSEDILIRKDEFLHFLNIEMTLSGELEQVAVEERESYLEELFSQYLILKKANHEKLAEEPAFQARYHKQSQKHLLNAYRNYRYSSEALTETEEGVPLRTFLIGLNRELAQKWKVSIDVEQCERLSESYVQTFEALSEKHRYANEFYIEKLSDWTLGDLDAASSIATIAGEQVLSIQSILEAYTWDKGLQRNYALLGQKSVTALAYFLVGQELAYREALALKLNESDGVKDELLRLKNRMLVEYYWDKYFFQPAEGTVDQMFKSESLVDERAHDFEQLRQNAINEKAIELQQAWKASHRKHMILKGDLSDLGG